MARLLLLTACASLILLNALIYRDSGCWDGTDPEAGIHDKFCPAVCAVNQKLEKYMSSEGQTEQCGHDSDCGANHCCLPKRKVHGTGTSHVYGGECRVRHAHGEECDFLDSPCCPIGEECFYSQGVDKICPNNIEDHPRCTAGFGLPYVCTPIRQEHSCS